MKQVKTATLVHRIREAIGGSPNDDHHNACDWHVGKKCDCYARHRNAAHEALTELERRVSGKRGAT